MPKNCSSDIHPSDTALCSGMTTRSALGLAGRRVKQGDIEGLGMEVREAAAKVSRHAECM